MIRALLVLIICLATAFTAEPIATATGSSRLTDAKAAAREAALQAQKGLHGLAPKLVLIHAPHDQMTDALLAGVSEIFPAALIHGGEVYAPLAGREVFADQGVGIRTGVAVLALGGTVTVTCVDAPLPAMPDKTARYAACGTALGQALQPALAVAASGKAVLTIGQQHTGDNIPFAQAFAATLAPGIPLMGGAMSGGAKGVVIVRGQRRTDVNVAIALTGDFACTTGHGQPGGDPLAQAQAAIRQAAPPNGLRPVLTLAFDSRTVRENLLKRGTLADECAALGQLAGSGTMFGFYGSGEIAPAAASQPAQGMGHVLAVVVFSVR